MQKVFTCLVAIVEVTILSQWRWKKPSGRVYRTGGIYIQVFLEYVYTTEKSFPYDFTLQYFLLNQLSRKYYYYYYFIFSDKGITGGFYY